MPIPVSSEQRVATAFSHEIGLAALVYANHGQRARRVLVAGRSEEDFAEDRVAGGGRVFFVDLPVHL